MLRFLLLAILLYGPPASAEEVTLAQYLPEGTYDDAIPVPRSTLGFEVGERHVRHDQLVGYLRRLAESSQRARIDTVGRTHEGRELVQLTLSAPENLARLEEILAEHRRLSDPRVATPDTSAMPVVVYLGYSVHGNEASGSNASMAVAYHLAAAESEAVAELLRQAVVVIDPALNPDGLDRFALWANMHRGRIAVADPEHREHREPWPNGRTNHYWFDLNRDWLPAQHPESRARLERFYELRPNVQADFHEMGTDSTYFFQPGVPSRQNPLTPARNLELTRELAGYHARALDRAGSLYFTEERFDDFYYGKGSTYPDLVGSVGILFEQASARGHLQESENGELSFPFAVRNQVLTSLSTLAGALAHRRELLDYQAEFARGALELAAASALGGYVFGEPADPARVHRFLELLRLHRVEVHELGEPVEVEGRRFEPGSAYVVPSEQAQVRLVRTLFETRLTFEDTTFYDVSTWTLPLAFGLPYAALERRAWRPALVGERVGESAFPAARFETSDDARAYLLDWSHYYAPRALYRLLERGVRVRVATRPFTAAGPDGPRRHERGTLVVPLGIQELERPALEALLRRAAEGDGVEVAAAVSGLTPAGVDLGSPSLEPLAPPSVALLVGGGVEPYAAGEIWHLLDRRFEMPLTLLDAERLASVDLRRYTHLILADGDYRALGEGGGEEIRRWVAAGGTLVALQSATAWTEENVLRPQPDAPQTEAQNGPQPAEGSTASRSGSDPGAPAAPGQEPERRPYGEHDADRAVGLIGGAILEVELDLTHPLAFGYLQPRLPVFRTGNQVLAPQQSPYTSAAVYTAEPLLSGYVSSENLARIRSTPAIVGDRLKRGAVVRILDDPAFRGFWYGTDKLLGNALFFAPVLEPTPPPP